MPTYLKNKSAHRNYVILDEYEAGIKLTGQEVKAIREGKGNLKGTYVKITGGVPYLVGFNLPQYSKSGALFHYDPKRDRRLLLNKREIKSLIGKTEQKGLTLIPLRLYTKNGFLKISVGVARGKKKKERRQDIIRKQQDREIERLLKQKTL